MRFERHLSPCLAVLALIAALALGGCIPIVVGGAATAGYAAGQERGVGGTVKDTQIRAEINDKWLRYSEEMFQQLSLSVYEGRVLVTGAVSNPEWRDAAARLAWQADGVKEVNNEVQLVASSGIGDAAKDKLITTRLRSAILIDGDVRSVNYTIDTVNGIVFLSGSARTQGELDKVTNYARNIPNVKRVVSYVKIRPGEAGTAEAPAASAPAAPVAAPATAPATSAPATIQVQPLQ